MHAAPEPRSRFRLIEKHEPLTDVGGNQIQFNCRAGVLAIVIRKQAGQHIHDVGWISSRECAITALPRASTAYPIRWKLIDDTVTGEPHVLLAIAFG